MRGEAQLHKQPRGIQSFGCFLVGTGATAQHSHIGSFVRCLLWSRRRGTCSRLRPSVELVQRVSGAAMRGPRTGCA
eukprot:10311544-Alexandrium_andersonii.AAC.1